MATINYKCNTCKRSIELLENKKGLTTLSKCIITYGCNGKLYKVFRNQDSNREIFPSEVRGLEDYTPRQALYNFKQLTSSKIWNIKHNLNSNPSVSVFIEDNTGNISKTPLDDSNYIITIVDSNNIKIEFNNSYKGVSQLNSRSSVKYELPSVATQSQLFQVTNKGYFVFAIPKYLTKFTYPPSLLPTPDLPLDLKNSPIRLEINIKKPNQEEVICTETLDFSLNNTAWLGTNEILIRKRRNYYIFSKSILQFRTFGQDNLQFNQIPNGTQLKILGIDYGTGVIQPIKSEGLYILLALQPYTPNDKIKNKLINVGEILKNDIDYFSYNNTDFFIDENDIETTYPDILRVS